MLNGKNLRRKSGCAYPNPDRRGRDRPVRGTYSSSSIWTDGVIGTNDDITTEPARSSYTNFDAAYIEAVGARVFEKVDPAYVAYALKIAKDDFHWGITIYREQQARHYRQKPDGAVHHGRRRLSPPSCSSRRFSSPNRQGR